MLNVKNLSKKSNQLIEELVATKLEENNDIQNIKSAEEGKAVSYKKALEELGNVRGRPLFYPYLSAGKGKGPFVELMDGSVKLDLINAIGVYLLGHNSPILLKAGVEAGLEDAIMQGNLQISQGYYKLASKLKSIASKNSRLEHVWISPSGAMANENALKICRQKKSPAKKIIALTAAFAGRTTFMAEITDNPAYKQGLPAYDEVLRVPFVSSYSLAQCEANPKLLKQEADKALAELKKQVNDNPGDIAAFMFELIQGEGGFKIATRDFWVPLLEFCQEKQIPVWVDEVQTFLRTGEFFAFEKLQLGKYIDVCTVAKAVQVGATFYTKAMNPKPGLIAGTFASSSVALSAGYATLNYLEKENCLGKGGAIDRINTEMTDALTALSKGSCKGLISDIGGMGLMIALTPLDGSKEKTLALLKTLYKNGLVAFSCGHGPYRLRFLCPAILTTEHIQLAVSILEKSLTEVSNSF
ncbi:MAG: aminotransferase class III-fold pyridoxal phosphate-dependent enzyme [Bdellovibrionaceae bacterium]|nr:aminotransferase class III-fold pyridoxal phosphate-dependent enzyme [Pseudobdellovibrionaceae bacterium]